MLIINTPLGRMLPTIDGVKEFEIRIGELVIEMDSIVLEIVDYDVVLGLDWLSKYHACVNYYHKTVTLCFKDRMTYTFQGN